MKFFALFALAAVSVSAVHVSDNESDAAFDPRNNVCCQRKSGAWSVGCNGYVPKKAPACSTVSDDQVKKRLWVKGTAPNCCILKNGNPSSMCPSAKSKPVNKCPKGSDKI